MGGGTRRDDHEDARNRSAQQHEECREQCDGFVAQIRGIAGHTVTLRDRVQLTKNYKSRTASREQRSVCTQPAAAIFRECRTPIPMRNFATDEHRWTRIRPGQRRLDERVARAVGEKPRSSQRTQSSRQIQNTSHGISRKKCGEIQAEVQTQLKSRPTDSPSDLKLGGHDTDSPAVLPFVISSFGVRDSSLLNAPPSPSPRPAVRLKNTSRLPEMTNAPSSELEAFAYFMTSQQSG